MLAVARRVRTAAVASVLPTNTPAVVTDVVATADTSRALPSRATRVPARTVETNGPIRAGPRGQVTDDDPVARAKQGDPDAWRVLYRTHAGRLVVWLSTRPSGDSAASPEDIAAEAWLVAAQKVAEFHGTTSAFAGWLFGIARNLAATNSRRSARRRTDPAETDATLELPVDDDTAALAGQDWVRRALAALPPRERDAVGCIDGLGLDTAATAEALGISVVAVRVARHRGLRRLRRLLPDADQLASSESRSRTAAGGSTER
jgi:RNA polymerase sigma-70 factor, ECF subfamily